MPFLTQGCYSFSRPGGSRAALEPRAVLQFFVRPATWTQKAGGFGRHPSARSIGQLCLH